MAGSRRKDHRYVLFNTDCEGPTVANDHAHEVAKRWARPHGDRLFRQLSNFDDYTAYVLQRPFYNTGDTLRLMLPFLKGVGQLTDDRLESWTRTSSINWIDGAVDAIKKLLETDRIEVFEISASYYPFAALVAENLGIRKDRVYSTYFSLDNYEMARGEAARLRQLATEIVELDDIPEIALESGLRSIEDFPAAEQSVLKRMTDIVWGEMATELPCASRMLKEIRSMGGNEKFNAIRDSLWRMQQAQDEVSAADVIYVGDSITDVEAFRAVSDMGGVSIAFNGNRHAVDAAEYCAWGDTSLINALVAGIFRDHGRDGLRDFAASGGTEYKLIPSELSGLHDRLLQRDWGIAERSGRNRDLLVGVSKYYRDKTRSAAATLS